MLGLLTYKEALSFCERYNIYLLQFPLEQSLGMKFKKRRSFRGRPKTIAPQSAPASISNPAYDPEGQAVELDVDKELNSSRN
jgi:hypothetical protein